MTEFIVHYESVRTTSFNCKFAEFSSYEKNKISNIIGSKKPRKDIIHFTSFLLVLTWIITAQVDFYKQAFIRDLSTSPLVQRKRIWEVKIYHMIFSIFWSIHQNFQDLLVQHISSSNTLSLLYHHLNFLFLQLHLNITHHVRQPNKRLPPYPVADSNTVDKETLNFFQSRKVIEKYNPTLQLVKTKRIKAMNVINNQLMDLHRRSYDERRNCIT